MCSIKKEKKKAGRGGEGRIVVTSIESSIAYYYYSCIDSVYNGRRHEGVARNGNHQTIFTLPVKLFSLANQLNVSLMAAIKHSDIPFVPA